QFDRAAHNYDQTRAFPPGVGEQVAAALVNLVGCSPADRILEIGIGTGRIARPLAALLGPNHRITGVDLSRKMMDRLVAATAPDVRRPQLAEASATFLPFPAETFRAILVVHVLHLVRDWQTAVAEALRVRAPGGVLVGGWNDHPPESSGERISQKFREVAKARGISTERQGLAHFRDVLAHLPPARADEIVAAEWTVDRAPRLALQSIAERHFSSAWLIPDDVFPAVLADVEAWAAREWRDLDQTIPERRRFNWMKLEFERGYLKS
ncbi:MAG: class I SAM-dependent methyltransferase, partial [Chloroflexota bacterium]